MWKLAAVTSSKGRKKLVSAADQPLISALVTMFVFTPHIRWTFTHSRLSTSLPYFLLNHFTNRLVENPEESTAKSDSTAFNGNAERVISCFNTVVISGLPMW